MHTVIRMRRKCGVLTMKMSKRRRMKGMMKYRRNRMKEKYEKKGNEP